MAECAFFLMMQRYGTRSTWNTHEFKDDFFERRKRHDISDFIDVKCTDARGFLNIPENQFQEGIKKRTAYVVVVAKIPHFTALGWSYAGIVRRDGKQMEPAWEGKTGYWQMRKEDLYEIEYLYRLAAQC